MFRCVVVAMMLLSGTSALADRQAEMVACIAQGKKALLDEKRLSFSRPARVNCPSPKGIPGVLCEEMRNYPFIYAIPPDKVAQYEVANVTFNVTEDSGGQVKHYGPLDGNKKAYVRLYCRQTECFGPGLSIGGNLTGTLEYLMSLDERRKIAGRCVKK